jgi:hypothetical protein
MNLDNSKKKLKAINNVDIFDHDIKFKRISILFKKIENDN